MENCFWLLKHMQEIIFISYIEWNQMHIRWFYRLLLSIAFIYQPKNDWKNSNWMEMVFVWHIKFVFVIRGRLLSKIIKNFIRWFICMAWIHSGFCELKFSFLSIWYQVASNYSCRSLANVLRYFIIKVAINIWKYLKIFEQTHCADKTIV